MFVRERLSACWRSLGGGDEAEALFGELAAAYGQSHRAYHTRAHVAQVLAEFDRAEGAAGVEDGAAAELAIWFHDAIYDTQARDNEERSAAWLEAAAADGGCDPARIARAAAHVRATAHGLSDPGHDPDTALVLDCDLSILGAEPVVFDDYDRAIRSEYAWVPPDVYARERANVLQAFLRAERIYRTAPFAAYEARARSNLQRALASLV